MREVRQIWRSEGMDGLKGKQKEFVDDPVAEREPVELLQNGGDVMR